MSKVLEWGMNLVIGGNGIWYCKVKFIIVREGMCYIGVIDKLD